MEIVKNFGLDPILLLAQIVNFLILVYLLNRFFLKKVLTFLKEREEKIRAGIESAQKGEELLVKAKESQKEILYKARKEATIFLQNAQKRTEEIVQNIKENGQKEADKIIEEARKTAVEESVRIQKELRKQTIRLAISILEKTLPGALDNEAHKKIIGNMTKNIKAPL